MRNYLLSPRRGVLSAFILALLLSPSFLFAQVRSYATRQATDVSGASIAGAFTNPANAVDGDPKTSSDYNLGIAIGAYREQILDFNPDPNATGTYAATIAANTPITIKVALPAGLLAAASGLEIQAVTDLHRTGSGIPVIDPYQWTYTNVDASYTNSSIAGLISGAGTTEITITPNAAFQGVRVRINSLLSLAYGISLYHAYIKVPAAGTIACSGRIDVLSGVKAGTVVGGIANATGSVANPWNAADAFDTTFAHLATGAQLLSQAYHTTIFNTPSKVGDTVKILAADPNGSILDLSLLSGFRINLYNGSGATPAQTILNTSPLLQLRLLGGTANKAYFIAVPAVVFDRVEIVIGGVAAAFAELDIYDVNRENAGVTLTAAQAAKYVYAGQSYTLAATSVTDDPVVYYDAATNGNIVAATTLTSTTAQAGTTLDYYAGTTRNGCTETSRRKKISVTVVGFTRTFPLAAILNQSYSGSIPVTNTTPLPLTPGFKYTAVTALPAGLTLNPKTGAITGTPTTEGSFSFNVSITDTVNNLPVGTFLYMLPVTNTPLASSLVSFTAAKNIQQVDLSWVTVSETGNKGFYIEKSTDGRTFENMGFVGSQYKTGTGTSRLQYSFTDPAPAAGSNYYRLKQVDFKGDFKRSNVISVIIDQAGTIAVFPNPASGVINIRTAKEAVITFFNTAGQTIKVPVVSSGDEGMSFDTKNMANGLYTVKIVSGNTITVKNVIVKH